MPGRVVATGQVWGAVRSLKKAIVGFARNSSALVVLQAQEAVAQPAGSVLSTPAGSDIGPATRS